MTIDSWGRALVLRAPCSFSSFIILLKTHPHRGCVCSLDQQKSSKNNLSLKIHKEKKNKIILPVHMLDILFSAHTLCILFCIYVIYLLSFALQ